MSTYFICRNIQLFCHHLIHQEEKIAAFRNHCHTISCEAGPLSPLKCRLQSRGRIRLASHPVLVWLTRFYCCIITVKHARKCVVAKLKLLLKPTASMTSRRCATTIISQSEKECEVIRKTIKTVPTTHFIYCIKLSKTEFEPVCKQAPIHSSVPTDSTLFHYLTVREHVSAALQGCGVTEQKWTNNLPNPVSHSVSYSAVYSFRSCRNSHFYATLMNHDQMMSGDLGKQADLPPLGVVWSACHRRDQIKTLTKSYRNTWLAYSWKRSFNGWQEVSLCLHAAQAHSEAKRRLFQSHVSYNLIQPLKEKWAKWGKVKRGSVAAKQEKQSSREQPSFSTISVVL